MAGELIVYVDTSALEMAVGLGARAALQGIETALVCPPGTAPADHDFVEVVETDDFGIDNLRRIVEALEQRWKVVAVTTCYGPYRPEGFVQEAVSVLADERGLPHSPVEAVARATDKFLARDALQAGGLAVGGFGLVTDEESARSHARRIGLPVVLKPVTGVGSSLVVRCDTEDEVVARRREVLELIPRGHYPHLRMAAHDAVLADGTAVRIDPVTTLLMEEYFPGREASVECLVVDRQVVPLVVHDKPSVDEAALTVYERVLVTPPERFTAAEVGELTDYARRAVELLGLRWCFCHVELRYVDGVGPRLLEVNPRIGAGCVADSIEAAWGFGVGAMHVDLVLGRAVVPPRRPGSTGPLAMALLFSPRSGTLRRLDGIERVRRLPEVEAVRVGYEVGDVVGGDAEEVFLVSVWMRVRDTAHALALHDRIVDLVDIEVT